MWRRWRWAMRLNDALWARRLAAELAARRGYRELAVRGGLHVRWHAAGRYGLVPSLSRTGGIWWRLEWWWQP